MTVQFTLIFSTVFSIVSAAVYGYVGWRLSKRVITSAESRVAWQAFSIWWYGLAVVTLIGGFTNLLGAFGFTPLAVFITAIYLDLLVVSLALCGLSYYLTYLFTGNSRLLKPVTIFYMIFYVLFVYYLSASRPENIKITSWNATLTYRTQPSGVFFGIMAIMLIVPEIIGGLAYFSLYFRVQEPTQKYRILLVSGSIVFWFLSPVLPLIGGFGEQDWWELTSRFIGLAAALTILIAYLPPRWLKQRYGVISLNDESPLSV